MLSVTTSKVAEVVRLLFSPPYPEVSRLLLLLASPEVMNKAHVGTMNAIYSRVPSILQLRD